MKKFIAIWIGCWLALAGVAMAQQDETQATPSKKHPRKQRAEQATPPSGAQSARQGAEASRPQPGRRARERAAENAQAPATNPTRPKANANARTRPEQRQDRQERRPTPAATAPEQAPAVNRNQRKPQKTETSATPGTAAQTSQTKPGARGRNVEAVKANAKQIKSQHTNFRAQPKPQKVPTVTYQANYRIQNSQRWQGPQYVAFRDYRPQWRDRAWYSSRYNRIVLIAGGYYYFDNGYWYPAWGYAPGQQYYAYNGPIYAGREAEPPDRVIADVQAELQQMGYYKGEVDGLLGPLTREALSQYQTDNGLYATEAIDEPTLASLGLT